VFSIPSALELKKKQLTFFETLKKNKREVPQKFHSAEGKEEMPANFGFTKGLILVSFVPKKDKVVLLTVSAP
jgi:hypothetical protein